MNNPSHFIARNILLGLLLLGFCVEVAAQRTTTRGGAGGRGGAAGGLGAARDYQNSTMVGDAMITSDPETRQLIIVTDDETNERIRTVIKSLDRPKPQVLIKVVFAQVTHGDNLDLGVEGSFTHRPRSGMTNNALSTLGLDAAQQAFGGGAYRVLKDDLDVVLRGLSVAGKTEILSRPSILARNNQQATIIVGQEVPFITNSRITDQGQTVNTVQYQDIGIILRVTPFITSDGMVEMILAPEISSLSDRTVPISETVNSPVIDKRSADTVVVTPHGRTVVIGGLIEKQKTDQDRKVPFLGDIPLLGYAFKRKVKADTRTELLIFLTPFVIQHPSELAKISQTESSNLKMTPETFKDEEVNRFFDGNSPIAGQETTKALKKEQKKSSKRPAAKSGSKGSGTLQDRTPAPKPE